MLHSVGGRNFSEIRTALLAEGLLHVLPTDKIEEIFGLIVELGDGLVIEVSFVDDGALPTFAAAKDIARKVARIISIIDSIFVKYGLIFNYSVGKTEVLIRFCGKDSVRARLGLLVRDGGIIKFTSGGVDKHIRACDGYKNLGSKLVIAGAITPEVTYRMSLLRTTLKAIRFKIICSPHISLKRKLLIVTSLISSRALHNAGTWKQAKVIDVRKFHRGVMTIWRAILFLDRPGCEHKTDQQVVDELGIFTPMTLLFLLRFHTFVRVCVKAQPRLLLVLASSYVNESFWIRNIEWGLNKLANHTNVFENMRGAALMDWCQLVRADPKAFKRALVQAVSEEGPSNVSFWADVVSQDDGDVGRGMEPLVCPCCDYECPTPQGLSWHLFSMHAVRSPMRSKVNTLHCACCMQWYDTRARRLRHIDRTSPRCGLFYLNHMPDLDEQEVAELDRISLEYSKSLWSRGFRREKSEVPPFRIRGPLDVRAIGLGVNFYSCLKKPPRQMPTVNKGWAL